MPGINCIFVCLQITPVLCSLPHSQFLFLLMLKFWPCFFLVLSIFLSSCNSDSSKSSQEGLPQLPSTQVVARSVTTYDEYPAQLRGILSSEIRAKVSGYIRSVELDEGAKVSQGEVLFRLETQALQGEIEAAQAAMKAAQVEVRNLKPLVEKDIVNRAQLETALANLAQVRSTYQGLLAQADYAAIKSPVDGLVGTFNFRRGALVSPSDAMPLTTVSDASSVFAYFAINEKTFRQLLRRLPGRNFLDKIDRVPPLQLILPTGETYSETGKLEIISRQVNPGTGTVTLRARFPNKQGALLNGGSATLQMPRRYKKIALVPSLSTFERQGATFVYTLGKGDTARAQRIEVIDQTDRLMLVKAGVKPGETILARGLAKVRSGDALKSQPIPFDSVATYEQVFQ